MYGYVPDECFVGDTLDRVLEPAGLVGVGGHEAGDRRLGPQQRERRVPRLVASHLGIRPVPGQHRRVGGPEATKQEPLRGDEHSPRIRAPGVGGA